jgi:peptidyl-prolyl cis-trans isomerase SDCCAG10
LRASKKKRAASPSSSSGSPPPKVKTSVLQAELASYSRGRGGGKGKGKAKEEDDVLAMLGSFRKKMQSAAPVRNAGGDSDGEDKGSDEEGAREIDRDEGWMGHRLIEERDEKAAEQTRRAETDYEVSQDRF